MVPVVDIASVLVDRLEIAATRNWWEANLTRSSCCGRTFPKATDDVLAIPAHDPAHPDSRFVRASRTKLSWHLRRTFLPTRTEVLASPQKSRGSRSDALIAG